MSSNSLLDVEIVTLSTQTELDNLFKVCRENNVAPLYPTHLVLKKGEIVGCFSITSPTVYWWMDPRSVTIRESLPVFQSCDTLMAHTGCSSYIIPCEPESPFFGILSKRLDTIKTQGGDDFKLFLNKG